MGNGPEVVLRGRNGRNGLGSTGQLERMSVCSSSREAPWATADAGYAITFTGAASTIPGAYYSQD